MITNNRNDWKTQQPKLSRFQREVRMRKDIYTQNNKVFTFLLLLTRTDPLILKHAAYPTLAVRGNHEQ